MSKLNVDQQTIVRLFSDSKSDFLIPDYQRPYAWGIDQCKTLWEDIFAFAFPDGNANGFNSKTDEYYLGPIVTFKNEKEQREIIDGQQRLTTLMLMLRAFYSRFDVATDVDSKDMKSLLAKCIWKTDELDRPQFNELKINSEVATDNDKDEFLQILKDGVVKPSYKSQYAENYRYFEGVIDDFIRRYALSGTCPLLPARILKNCILLPIEADKQDTALRIFSTLNDRGLPLSDADIFKAQFYKFYSKIGRKDEFIKRWKALEDLSNNLFHPISGTPMDELFTRYMYYLRALQGNKSSTTEALRKFYEKNKYEILSKDETLSNLEELAEFWKDVSNQDTDKFSDKVLRQLFVLNYAPNGMWYYFVTVYFMHNKDENGCLDNERFYSFLKLIIAFIWTYAVTNPGVNALRTPIYAEMINIVNDKYVDFRDFRFESKTLESMFGNYVFSNNRAITRSMLAWWALYNENQSLLSLETVFEIEHIYAKKRQELNNSIVDRKTVELLGNKSFLEKRINIRASDYRFTDKKKYYLGFERKNQSKVGTNIYELQNLAKELNDFEKVDIEQRNANIISSFIRFLGENNLLIKDE